MSDILGFSGLRMLESLSHWTSIQSSSNIDEGISVRHNLYDLLGNTLLQGVSDGELDTEKIKKAANKLHLQDVFLRLGLDLGKDYGAHIGYGDYYEDSMGPRRQDVKVTLTKDF